MIRQEAAPFNAASPLLRVFGPDIKGHRFFLAPVVVASPIRDSD
jgi:hypothetical protein